MKIKYKRHKDSKDSLFTKIQEMTNSICEALDKIKRKKEREDVYRMMEDNK